MDGIPRGILALLTAVALALLGAVVISVPKPRAAEVGIASWYGPGFHGREMANGERYDMNSMVCAHPVAKFGKTLLVTNLGNRRSIRCRVADRGPFHGGRVIDVSRKGAQMLGMIDAGTALVTIREVAP